MAAVPGLTDGFKFKPDDEEVVEFYLLRRLCGQPVPLDGVVIEDDPRSTPPWELFARNGLTKANEAYFMAPGDTTKNRKIRACADAGTWVGQKIENMGKLRIGEETFEWKKNRLNFHPGKSRSGSMGWVMLEYSIVVPENWDSFKVCHISFSGHGQKRQRTPDGYGDCDSAATHHQHAAAAPSSTTTRYQDPGATHQEHFLMQPQVYNDAAPVDGDYQWTYQEPLSTTTHQVADREMLPMADRGSVGFPGFFSGTSTAPVEMMPPQMDQEAYQETLATTTHQFVDQQSLWTVDLGSFGFPGFSCTTSTAPAMGDGVMPPLMNQETYVPEQSAEYGREPPLMNQEFGMPPEQFNFDFDDGPELGQLLESMGDFATAAQEDAGFGDHWAAAGQDYRLDHHVWPEQSFSTHDHAL